MKKKVLTKKFESFLTYLTIFEIMILGSINDFNFKAIPVIILFIFLILLKIFVLNTYGIKENY